MSNETKSRPILFNADMVRAVLDGRKTQTRRVIKQNTQELLGGPVTWRYSDTGHSGPGWYVWLEEYPDEGSLFYRCPYGKPGDLLWVRERWDAVADPGAEKYDGTYKGEQVVVDYYADGPHHRIMDKIRQDRPKSKSARRWKPSIHMPRWASRIQLRVTDVRVERVQDISPYDCHCEGIASDLPSNGGDAANPKWPTHNADGIPRIEWRTVIDKFRTLWDSINAKRGYGWEVNPWVWVVEFERITDAD